MSSSPTDRLVLACQRGALLGLPALLIAVFLLHFRGAADFLHFQLSYTPQPPAQVVASLIRSGNHGPLIHDPHVIAYLALPLFLVCASGLYALGRRVLPMASLIAMAVSVIGVIYQGGLFGMWAAFYRGLGDVDPRYLDGAIATFTAMSAAKGAFLLTTTLAKLSFVGIALQALVLLRDHSLPRWSPVVVAAGCGLFLCFWDLDNWMLIGAVLMLAGFLPMQARLRSSLSPLPLSQHSSGDAAREPRLR